MSDRRPLRQIFESHVSGPRHDTKPLRRQVAERVASASDPRVARLFEHTKMLLGLLNAKTTPLHVRLVHALTATLLARDDDQLTDEQIVTAEALVDEVATTVRRPDLAIASH